ncbi:MAG: dihydropteroate synthase [Planctomycetota bacterium]
MTVQAQKSSNADKQKSVAAPEPLRFPEGLMALDRPRIAGVLNVTPDSFSDGGRYHTVEAAVARGLAMLAEGADIIDVGGESSRPGAERVPPEEQIERVVQVIRSLRQAIAERQLSGAGLPGGVVSIDTTRRAVAEAALDAGASMLNDISAGREDEADRGGLLALAAQRGVPIVLMHMHGRPKDMQADPRYDDVVAEIEAFLDERLAAAEAAGVPRSQVVIDPGIGFGKTVAHNLAILRALPRYTAGGGTDSGGDAGSRGRAVMLGTSRKSFLAKLAGRPELKVEPDPPGGTAATTALGVAAGVRLFRVHDVALNRRAADAAAAIEHAKSEYV